MNRLYSISCDTPEEQPFQLLSTTDRVSSRRSVGGAIKELEVILGVRQGYISNVNRGAGRPAV